MGFKLQGVSDDFSSKSASLFDGLFKGALITIYLLVTF